MQVANGVKRVNGDPVKGEFQTHKQFSMKCYKAVKLLMMRAFCLSGSINQVNELEFPTDVNRMHCILEKYQKFRSLWERLVHEPSRMAALFLKSMRSYLRCPHAIALHDGWHLEIESYNLLSIWKMSGKTTYMRLQCECMEKFYDNDKVPPIYREIMRANNFCVKSSDKALAFDKENETTI
jgi:hypothetical protein